MSLEITFRWRGTCPRHRKYNPARQGESGIKGGCVDCVALFRVYRAELDYRAALVKVTDAFDGQADPEGRCRG